MPDDIATPERLEVFADGRLSGRTRTYQKRLGDMAGVYLDNDAYLAQLDVRGAEVLVYEVEEQSYSFSPGSLIVGTSTLLPGTVGDEYAVTRGHLHAIADRAELYYCLSGRGVMLLETLDGRSHPIELTPGQAVNVPGHWIHRSVNVGPEPFVTLFTYAADAGQDYSLIARAGGMVQRIVTDPEGWRAVANERHSGYRSNS